MPLLLNFKKFFSQEKAAPTTKVDDTTSELSSKNSLRSANLTVSSHSSSDPKSSKILLKDSDSIYPDLPSNYKLLNVLGEGAFSVVYKGFDSKTGKTVAIKVINKTDLNQKQLNNIKNEILIMKRLKHPNILKLIDAHNSVENCFLILEYCDGGEIFNKIIEYTYFSEDLSRHVFMQLLASIEYLHLKNIVHRDIKPENLLFEAIPMKPRSRDVFLNQFMRKSDDESKVDEGEFEEGVGGGTVGIIKLADFGLAKQLKIESMHKNLQTPCGTAGYTAPEVITCHDANMNMNHRKYDSSDRLSKKNYYSKSVDIWSLGCFMYTILSGFPPFYDDNPEVLTMKILKGEYVFLTPWWDEISIEAKDLISKMLVIKPEDRITADEIWKHPWVTKKKLGEEAKPETTVAEGRFPDNYFANALSPKQSFEHVEDTSAGDVNINGDGNRDGAGAGTEPPVLRIRPELEPEHIEHYESGPPSLVPSADNLALHSPRANAIKMVFNNPVICTAAAKENPNILARAVNSTNVKFTDSCFKKNYVSSSSDEEDLAYPKTPNPISMNFKNVFGKLKEDKEEYDDEDDVDVDDDEDEDEDDIDVDRGNEDEDDGEDDIGSLVAQSKHLGLNSKMNISEDSITSAEYGKDTRSSSIISGLNGDYKFTLNLNESSLLGRRKSSKSSKSSPNPNEPSSITPQTLVT